MALAEPLPETAPPAVGEDEILVDRFRAGDLRAFDELVRKHQRGIYYLARRYVRDPDEAKDVAQRAFVKAFSALRGLRGAGAFRTWLFKIAANLALNHLRDHARLRPVEELSEEPSVDAVGAARLADAEKQARLLGAIETLPPKQRLVLELRVFQELSFREVADAAGCSENAAKVNFHHAVKKLRACIEGLEGGDK
jgi:RNA polymerase sigma-70 factor, ECF subfamily